MSFEKYKILMWKNWIIQKRNPKSTIFEFLFPIGVVILLTWTRSFFNLEGFTYFALQALPILLVFCLFYSVNTTIRNVAIEREGQLKEIMKIMGLSSGLHWIAWFTKVFTSLILSFTIVTIFLCVQTIGDAAIFGQSNFFLVWLFFVVYISTVITLCFLISVIFKKSNTAANIGMMVFFATVIPYNQFTQHFSSFHYAVKFLFCMPVNTGFGEGIAIILRFERDIDGLQFDNFFSRGEIGFSFAEVLLVMLVAISIQILLTIYIENVFPGDIGIAKPWHYPFSWCLQSRKQDLKLPIDERVEENRIGENFEDDPTNFRPGIEIKNLSKSFGKLKAVNQLSLKMFEDQITILLGHNGSGKTTTMNILIGMIPPSSGTAVVNGFDVRTQIEDARLSLGLCPQTNVLFDDLTVKEHIQLFCRLKGMRVRSEIDDELTKFVTGLGLEGKMNAISRTLSGGMKRKLTTINALCGNSKIVICDEPSSGIDVGARRELWDLLIKEKKGRTILLTTHHMDEAEMLGDRVAILSDGQLQTVGSPYFLKKTFGSGYRLTCVKQPGCDPRAILSSIQRFSSDAQLVSNAQSEAVFSMPEKDVPSFENIFKTLEDDSEDLKISNFGCAFTSLEEVFLNIGTDVEIAIGDYEAIEVSSESCEKVSGFTSVAYQTYAMVLKKLHFLRRNYYMFVWVTLLSAWLIFVFMASPVGPFDETLPPLEVNPLNLFMVLFLFFFLSWYWPSIFINMKIKERVTRSKLLQFVCGANRFVFWISSFLIDFVIFTTVMSIIVGIIALYQRDNFTTATELGSLILIFTFYGFAILPAIYLFSFLFEKHATGEGMVPLIILISGLIYVVYLTLKLLVDNQAVHILADIIYWLGLFLAPFSLLDCFYKYFVDAFNPDTNIINFGDNGIGWNLIIMKLSGLLFLSICLMIDFRVFESFKYKFTSQSPSLLTRNDYIDDDVQAEIDRVKNLTTSQIADSNLVLKGLTKYYSKFLAVNQIYLDVDSSECFGLIGINGAGKTSTFKMMIGDEFISHGDVWMRGLSIKNHGDKLPKSYCPQFDALLMDLTGRELLKIFSLIRGIPRGEIANQIEKLSMELDFHKHLDKKAKVYSGGNKRKLSAAISLLGDPNLIFLDEPSTGMDPKAKRKLWDAVNKARNAGKSVILTSHSMDECEALCTRLAIMVDGEFKCLGSVQHLKNKFAKGFILTIKMKQENDVDLSVVKQQVELSFPSATVKEEHSKLLTFHIIDVNFKWSHAFGVMIRMKEDIEGMSDFILSQMSLEQVFLFFSKRVEI